MIWGFGRGAFINTQIFVRFFYDPLVVYTGHIATFGTDFTSFGTVAGATFYNCTVTGPGLVALGQAYRPQVCTGMACPTLGFFAVEPGHHHLSDWYQRALPELLLSILIFSFPHPILFKLFSCFLPGLALPGAEVL